MKRGWKASAQQVVLMLRQIEVLSAGVEYSLIVGIENSLIGSLA